MYMMSRLHKKANCCCSTGKQCRCIISWDVIRCLFRNGNTKGRVIIKLETNYPCINILCCKVAAIRDESKKMIYPPWLNIGLLNTLVFIKLTVAFYGKHNETNKTNNPISSNSHHSATTNETIHSLKWGKGGTKPKETSCNFDKNEAFTKRFKHLNYKLMILS